MRWVLGTGRCGMQNYTLWKGGFIESSPKLREIAVKRFHGDATDLDLELAKRIILDRSKLDTVSVADCCQFMFIDLMKLVDPKAEFVWLYRDKEQCVRSFMDRGAEEQRIHPKGWRFSYDTKRQLMEWYHDTVNRLIGEGLVGTKFEKINTTDMPLLVAA